MSHKILLPLGLVAAAIALCLVIFMVIDTTPIETPSSGEVSAPLEVNPPPPRRDLPDFPSDPSSGGNLGLGADFSSRTQDGRPSPEALAAAMSADTLKDPQAKEAVFEVIQDASTTYDVEGLVVLGPLLKHSDPEVREATIEGIVQLGDAAGAKTLREAAAKTKDSKLKDRLLSAAQFLELPEYVPSKDRN